MNIFEVLELVKLVIEIACAIITLIGMVISVRNAKKSKLFLSKCEEIKFQLENLNIINRGIIGNRFENVSNSTFVG